VSNETPAAPMARLKVTYQGWRIARDCYGALQPSTGRPASG
jgi:hypothetical protein